MAIIDDAALTFDEARSSGAAVLRVLPSVRLEGALVQSIRARRLKRAMDVSGAVVLIVVLLPVLMAAALAVKIGSRGPVLFRQSRVGRNGHEFTMLKFRTFPTDHVDVTLSLPIDQCPSRIGRFLRRSSIDELPQLLNVIRGDMSLVGPRPERPQFATVLAGEVPGYTERHRVLGGITGLAQVHGYWGLGDIEERVRLDNRYIDNWSVWADTRILLKTLPELFVKAFPK